jgi:hypothetical protein
MRTGGREDRKARLSFFGVWCWEMGLFVVVVLCKLVCWNVGLDGVAMGGQDMVISTASGGYICCIFFSTGNGKGSWWLWWPLLRARNRVVEGEAQFLC